MIISHSKKFIFIHIFKTGGTSVTNVFLPYARFIEKISTYWPYSRYLIIRINNKFNLSIKGNKWINGLHKHSKASVVKDYLGRKYDKYLNSHL